MTGVIELRPYEPGDYPALYDVCLRTSDAGQDGSHLFTVPALPADIFVAPYLAFDPELATSVVRDGAVVGYLVATADTRQFVQRYTDHWLPRFQQRYGLIGAPGSVEDDFVRMGLDPSRMLIAEVDQYPAHLHVDLLPEAQGQGVGRRLMERVEAQLLARGVTRVHLEVDATNTGGQAFYAKLGFTALPSGALGKTLNKLSP